MLAVPDRPIKSQEVVTCLGESARGDPLHFDEVVSVDNGGEFRLRLVASRATLVAGTGTAGWATSLLYPLFPLSQQSN